MSVCPAIKYGLLNTKVLERYKYLLLFKNNYKYETIIVSLPDNCQQDLGWWLTNIKCRTCPIRKNTFITEIHTDASTTGWSASCGTETAHGHWTKEEFLFHINIRTKGSSVWS